MSVMVMVTKADGTDIVVNLSEANRMRTAGELQDAERDGTELSQADIMGTDYDGETTLSNA